jgi:hypothetical protein
MSDTQPYKESDEHVPNPYHQTGVVDTTGTFGDTGARIENVSPVFAQAKAAAFANAVDAIDDPDRDESEVVVFHDGEEGQLDRATAEEQLRQAAEDAAANPQLDNPAATPAAVEAAESEDDSDDGSDSGDEDSDEDDGLPKADDSKAKWVEYAGTNDLDVDQSLRKEEYVAAVRKAAADKAAASQ